MSRHQDQTIKSPSTPSDETVDKILGLITGRMDEIMSTKTGAKIMVNGTTIEVVHHTIVTGTPDGQRNDAVALEAGPIHVMLRGYGAVVNEDGLLIGHEYAIVTFPGGVTRQI